MAANQSPVFAIGQPEKYSDPQEMDYFQILQAGRKRNTGGGGRSRDRDWEFPTTHHHHHLKIQKPISKDAGGRKKKKKKRTRWWRRWWKSATGLRFWKCAETTGGAEDERTNPRPVAGRVRLGPLYMTESSGVPRAPCRRRTGGGGLLRSSALVAAEVGTVELPPYVSLRDTSVPPSGAAAPPAMPVYFVS